MKRIFHQYQEMEDFKNGMYRENKNDRNERVKRACEILGDKETCRKAMETVVSKWKNATEYNLSNDKINKKAWLGQACCSIYANVHEDETREGWGLLTDNQREQANKIANEIITNWVRRHQGQISLFDLGEMV